MQKESDRDRRCRYIRCKVTSREVTGFRQKCDKVLRYFEVLFFVFIRRKVHFITVTLQRCYKYDDREKAMRRYFDDLSEASVGENWTCVHTKWRSVFADLCNVSELPVLKMQKHVWNTEVTLLKILADDKILAARYICKLYVLHTTWLTL